MHSHIAISRDGGLISTVTWKPAQDFESTPSPLYANMSYHQASRSNARNRPAVASSRDATEIVSWGKNTFQGPAWVDSDAAVSKKHHYFEGWKAAIVGSSAPNEDKLGAFGARFIVGNSIALNVAHETSDLLDPDTSQPELLNNRIFTFSDFEVQSSKGRLVQTFVSSAIGRGSHLRATLADRLRARFVSARLSVHAASGGISCNRPAFTAQVLIPIPLVTSATGIEASHPDIYAPLIAQPRKLMKKIKRLTGRLPEIGTFKELKSGHFIAPDPDLLRRQYLDWVRGIQFELAIPKFRDTYVGILNDASLHGDLSECKQTLVDLTTRKLVSRTVSAYHEDFLQRMATMENDTNTDLARLFFYNLDPEVRAAMEAQANFRIPPRVDNTVQEQYARVEHVRRGALKAEKTIRASVQAVAKATGLRRGAFASPAIAAFAGVTSFADAEAESQQWDFDTGGEEVGDPAVGQGTNGIEHAICMMSAAETALTRAVGESRGETARFKRRCWGCDGDEEFTDDADHMFGQCTRKHIPRVAARARKAASAWYENRRATSGARRGIGAFAGAAAAESVEERTAAMTANWEKEGLPSEQIAVLLSSALKKETPPESRVQLLIAIGTLMMQGAAL